VRFRRRVGRGFGLQLDHVDRERIGEDVLEEGGGAEEQPAHAAAVLAARRVRAPGGGLAHVRDLRAAQQPRRLLGREGVGATPAVLELADERGDRAARLVRRLHASVGPLDQRQQAELLVAPEQVRALAPAQPGRLLAEHGGTPRQARLPQQGHRRPLQHQRRRRADEERTRPHHSPREVGWVCPPRHALSWQTKFAVRRNTLPSVNLCFVVDLQMTDYRTD